MDSKEQPKLSTEEQARLINDTANMLKPDALMSNIKTIADSIRYYNIHVHPDSRAFKEVYGTEEPDKNGEGTGETTMPSVIDRLCYRMLTDERDFLTSEKEYERRQASLPARQRSSATFRDKNGYPVSAIVIDSITEEQYAYLITFLHFEPEYRHMITRKTEGPYRSTDGKVTALATLEAEVTSAEYSIFSRWLHQTYPDVFKPLAGQWGLDNWMYSQAMFAKHATETNRQLDESIEEGVKNLRELDIEDRAQSERIIAAFRIEQKNKIEAVRDMWPLSTFHRQLSDSIRRKISIVLVDFFDFLSKKNATKRTRYLDDMQRGRKLHWFADRLGYTAPSLRRLVMCLPFALTATQAVDSEFRAQNGGKSFPTQGERLDVRVPGHAGAASAHEEPEKDDPMSM
jgi:hypothetical protein